MNFTYPKQKYFELLIYNQVNKLISDIVRIQPKEIVVPERFKTLLEKSSDLANLFGKSKSFSVSFKPNKDFNRSSGRLKELLLINDPKKLLKSQISLDTLQSFSPYEVSAGSALLTYIDNIFPSHIKPIFRTPELNQENQMILDSTALQALEIIKTSKDQSKKVDT